MEEAAVAEMDGAAVAETDGAAAERRWRCGGERGPVKARPNVWVYSGGEIFVEGVCLIE